MSYARSVVKSLQRGTIALSGTSATETDTATISSVATSGSAPFEAQAMYVLTNATTVSVTRSGGANSTNKTVSYQVVEYF